MKKSLFLAFLIMFFSASSFAINDGTHHLANITGVDDYEIPLNYIEVSEEGLPREHYIDLLQRMDLFRFTQLPEKKVSDLFKVLTRNSQARMRSPGGKCSQRRAFIQSYLKKMSIVSGKILVKCPDNNGRLRLRDQVSGRFFTYSNFHDANIVAIKTSSGPSFRVLDLQFQNTPVSLQDYLTEIESSQRIRPTKWNASRQSICYWSITTPYLTF
jgi:hypothetical protein